MIRLTGFLERRLLQADEMLHYGAGSDLRTPGELDGIKLQGSWPCLPINLKNAKSLPKRLIQSQRLSGIHLPIFEPEGAGVLDSDIDPDETETEDESFLESIEEEPRTVLITGACGNIGRKLRAAWADVYDLVLIDRVAGEDDEDIITADLEILDDDWITHFHGVDTVVHLAANTDEFASWDDLIGPNLDALANVFHAAALAGVERLIFASSNHVMGERQGRATSNRSESTPNRCPTDRMPSPSW